MSTDGIHAISALASYAAICAGAYIIGGSGPALLVGGVILMAGVIYARTKAIALRVRDEE